MELIKSRREALHCNLKEDRWTKAGQTNPHSRAEISILWNFWISPKWKRKPEINAAGKSNKEMAETCYLKIQNAEGWRHCSIYSEKVIKM